MTRSSVRLGSTNILHAARLGVQKRIKKTSGTFGYFRAAYCVAREILALLVRGLVLRTSAYMLLRANLVCNFSSCIFCFPISLRDFLVRRLFQKDIFVLDRQEDTASQRTSQRSKPDCGLQPTMTLCCDDAAPIFKLIPA